MTEQPQSPRREDDTALSSDAPVQPETTVTAATPAPLAPAPGPAPTPLDRGSALAAERPEVAVGAAFAGGFVVAMILRRLAR